MELRIGHGYDAHRLISGRRLVLGGVEIPWEKGLEGHSDADVLLHAVMDAFLGALALGDIGGMFPDSDMRYKDADSAKLMEAVWKRVADLGWRLGNLDVTVIAQQPKLKPYISDMRARIAAICGAEEGRVNVKATTEERMGFTGAGQGICAHAVCLLERT